MSNRNNPTTTRPQDTPEAPAAAPQPKKNTLDLSLSQTLGGALAAMTAAALGSRLGVAGTITGAAVASIVAGVAGTLYTASLRRTREKVKTVWTGRVASSDTRAAVDVVPEAPDWDLPEAAVATPRRTPTPPAPPSGSRALPWKGMVAAVLAVFVIAAAALTAFEELSGAALSGGKGTTISQVTKHKAAAKPSKKASASDTASPSETPSPSDTPSSDPTQQPSNPATSASTDPTEQPSATEAPSQTTQGKSGGGSSQPTTSSSAGSGGSVKASAQDTPAG